MGELTKKGLKEYLEKKYCLGRICRSKRFFSLALTNLEGMRKLLTPKGNWIKGTYDNGHGKYCLVGANRKVNGKGELYAWFILYYAVKELTTASNPAGFNDAHSTKHSDILELLDKAIALTKSCLPAKRKASAALLAAHKLPVK